MSSLVIYKNSIILAPSSITNHIDRFHRQFLWQGGRSNGRKNHLIKWNRVLEPFNKGGLAIRDSRYLHKALSAKILWNISTREEGW